VCGEETGWLSRLRCVSGGEVEEVRIDVTSLLVWSEGEASSGEEGEPAASRDNWSSLARLATASRSPATMGKKGPLLLFLSKLFSFAC